MYIHQSNLCKTGSTTMPRVFKTDHLKKSIIYKRGRKFSLHIIIKVKLFNWTFFFLSRKDKVSLTLTIMKDLLLLIFHESTQHFYKIELTSLFFFTFDRSHGSTSPRKHGKLIQTIDLMLYIEKKLWEQVRCKLYKKINLKLNYITLKECKKRLCYNFKVTIQLHIWDL